MTVGSALAEAASREGAELVRHLRNFDPSAYPQGKAVLDAAATAWASRALAGSPRDDDAKTAHLAFTSQNEEWNRAMKRALRSGLRRPVAAGTVLHWFQVDEGLTVTVGSLVPDTEEQEDAFVESLQNPEGAEAVAGWARKRRWPVLFARALELSMRADGALLLVAAFGSGRVESLCGA